MTLTISAADANRRFSEIVGTAQHGDTVMIINPGRPVARPDASDEDPINQRRDAALSRLLRTMSEGLDLGGDRFDRNVLYER